MDGVQMTDRRGALVAMLALALALLASALVAEAQEERKVPRIGLIRPGSPPDPYVAAFLRGLRDLGYVDGQTIAIEYRWGRGKTERFPEFTEELVRLKVDVIVTSASVGGRAAKRITSTIPVVIPAMVPDELVAGLARPGGNITGLSIVGPELAGKRLQLLKETLPKVSHVAVLHDPRTISRAQLQATESAGRALGLRLLILEVGRLEDLATAFAAAKTARAGALILLESNFFFANRIRIVQAVAKTRLPAMYENRQFVDAGGLISYGPNFPDLFRRAATYVDKILKGAKPADLPVEQPMTFEFAINLRTAKNLGLTIPPSVVVRANEVIQ